MTNSTHIRKTFQTRIHTYTKPHEIVGWGSEESQDLRIKVLLDALPSSSCSLLDVGCGVGRMVEHLNSMKFDGQYQGIDLVPEMVDLARKTHPTHQFDTGNIEDRSTNQTYDYVVSSGIFYLLQQQPFESMKRLIRSMFHAANYGVAFNSLSAWSKAQSEDEFNADPIQTLNFCKSLTSNLLFRHDYLPHDFTIFLFK